MEKCQIFAMHTLCTSNAHLCIVVTSSWTSISQSLAEQTQALSNKHHVSLQPIAGSSITYFLGFSHSGDHQIC
jgi:hypothetical protein